MKILAAFLVAAAAEPCAVPASFPRTSRVSRRFFGLLSTLDFTPLAFHETPGFCRKGPSWKKDVKLDTNAGKTRGAINNEYGDKLWFCFEKPRTLLGCMAECEARPDCGSFDRPPNEDAQECCLFWEGNTGDDLPDRQCWVRQEDQSDLPPGSLLGTSVTVMPVPIFTMLKLDSSTRGVVAEANRWFCPTWTWCDFTIKDCFGNVLYEVSAEWTTDLDSDGVELLGTEVKAYIVTSPTGEVLGRTSRLTDGAEPVRLFNVQKQQVAIMITPEDWFLRTFYPLEWFVDVGNPSASVEAEPMQDPRLLTMIVTFQFRSLGYVATLPLLLFVLAAFFAVYYYVVVLRKQGRFVCLLPYWLQDCVVNNCGWCSGMFVKRQQLILDESSTSCCGGRSKTLWKTQIQPLTPAE